ncbi:Nucleolar protein 56 [Gracilariopsis chorda]|uniref:Nucleolar protein 56 n=1 Tax=Gracilariopsis chorda TaxID=448386 RepID=A0A2V3IPU7_9FLOR|nr:Nucleolar protein 56 [Gracilariopsis chorda]|eukprot:PXF44106.1 Nucleolar protein 56 [Gracilariopsis chorda]
MVLYLLSESALGYALFEVSKNDVIAAQEESMQTAITEYSRFARMVKLSAFAPFLTAQHALENASMISEGAVSDFLKNFMETNLPLSKKKNTQLGIHRDPKLKSALADALGSAVTVTSDEQSDELLRGVRMHLSRFISGLKATDTVKAQLGLAHSYSRSKVKFNVHKADNMIIQSIALLDQLDKDINTFAMRVREWYSWHFPELVKVVPDNIQYARAVGIVRDKSKLTEESLPELNKVLMNEDQTRDVLDAARLSMGTDISEVDLVNIDLFASRVVQLAEYRASLHNYLRSKMSVVAPNLAALIGEQVGARLISHAGSLTSLAKYPASTVQILGAEKALFRALKTKGKTPKYGLLYHSTYIGKAKLKNKGRISRYLANKCSIASRMDCFAEVTTDVFGRKLREQVEERLRFYESGKAPRKNIDVMHEAVQEAQAEKDDMDETEMKLESKEESEPEKVEEDSDVEMKTPDDKPKKKKKKDKSSSKKEKETSSSKKEKSSSKKDRSSKKEKKRKRESSGDKDGKKKKKKADS